MLDSDWYPPRPANLREFRETLVNRLTSSLSVAVVASATTSLATNPTTDPDAAARHAEALLRQLQGDLRHATLYHADHRVATMVALLPDRTDPLVLLADMIPARHGLVVSARPVAFTHD